MDRFILRSTDNIRILPVMNLNKNKRTYWMKNSLRKRMINKIYEGSNN